MKHKIFIIVLFFSAIGIHAEQLSFFGSCSVYLPEGWGVLGNETDKVTFADPAQKSFLQIKRYTGDTYNNPQEIYSSVLSRIGGSGEGDGYLYESRDSWFGNISFSISGTGYRGFVVCIDGKDSDYVVLGFAVTQSYPSFHDFILSAMDSFALDDAGLLSPGAVSQYYYPVPGQEKKTGYMIMNGKKVLYTFDRNELEASQVVVEREARVLSAYGKSKLRDQAWIRYYRMIFRDNYIRLSRIAGVVRRNLFDDFASLSDLEKSSILLSWIQKYQYFRTGTLSDFLSPVSCLVERKGDCDSKGLLYIILLKHYGIDGILMVSSVYSHSIAGVAVNGEGARFTLDGVSYLVAETTDEVAIGLIDRNMADPSKWLGIKFP